MVLSWSNPHGFLSLHNHLLSLNTSYYHFLHLLFALRSIKYPTTTKMYTSAFLQLLHPNTRRGLNNDTATNVRLAPSFNFKPNAGRMALSNTGALRPYYAFTTTSPTGLQSSISIHRDMHWLWTYHIARHERHDLECMYGHPAADWINRIKSIEQKWWEFN